MSEASKAVFLSYASQDAEAAKRIADALRAAGVEVWFDQSELVGGDAWDQKIRKQIRECALLIPVISKTTQGRREAYFRLEWKLADERTHLMARGTPFLLPVSIDETSDRDALVPDSFLAVQWTLLRSLSSGGQARQEDDPALAKFAARVRKLLGAEVEVGRPRPAQRDEGVASPRRSGPSKWWWALPMFGVMMALFLVMKEGRKDPGPALSSSNGPPTAVTPVSEAQKLVNQARQIQENGDELNRDNLFLAEELVQRAIALDPAEPTAWELGAWLSYIMVWHSIEDTQVRRETLQRQASRAVALAPDSVAAQLVFANSQLAGRFGSAELNLGRYAEIEASLKRLAEREPQNWKIQRALGTVYRLSGRMEDGIRTLQRAVELSGEHPMASADLVNVLIRYDRYPEAEPILTRALARHQTGRLLTFDLVVKCRWRGDAAGAVADVARWPEWLLQQDRGIAVAWQAALWARKPASALGLVRQFPRQYVRDLNFSGPRAVLSARANELAENNAAAQADWRTALQQCDQELAANGTDIIALYWKAWALARLGDQAGAQATATMLRQRIQSVPNNFVQSYTASALWATVGWTDLAISSLRNILEKPLDYFSLSRAYLELEPAYDSIRSDVRFQELVAAAPAPKNAAEATPAKVDDKSVAVLAFANLSDDKNNEYFSDGISEELLNVLAKVPGLKVSARTSAFYFKGKEVPVPEIARQLGVAYVVEGSVRKQGDKVRITAQLIKAADGFHVWSDTFTRDLKDIFAVQDEIAGLIAKNLQLKLGESEHAVRPVNPEAHQLYLRARAEWRRRTEEAFDRADALLQQALALDPEFAPAYAMLAYVGLVRDDTAPNFDTLVKPTPQVETTLAYANRALQLDASSADAHVTLAGAHALMRQWPEAEREFRRAIELNPNHATAHQWLGRLLEAEGRMDEAIPVLRRATELDPLSSRIFDNLAMILIHAGQLAGAREAIERAVLLQPDNRQALAVKADILLRMGRLEEARPLAADAVNRLLTSTPVDTTFGQVCRVLPGLVDPARAAEAYERIPTKAMGSKVIAAMQVGRKDEALARLDPTMLSYWWTNEMLWNDTLDPIRDTPRFREFIQKAGLTEYQLRVQAWRAAHPPEKSETKK